VEIPEMVVDTVKQKWVSPEIAGFLVTFRFTPHTRFLSRVPCDCGNLSGGVVSGRMRRAAAIPSGKLHFFISAISCRHRSPRGAARFRVDWVRGRRVRLPFRSTISNGADPGRPGYEHHGGRLPSEIFVESNMICLGLTQDVRTNP
jgi:hypothetical protein